MPLMELIGTGLASLAGDVIGGIFNKDATDSANESREKAAQISGQFGLDSAREQMAYQERMSSSAYQRATEDMEKAGLNPMLAFSQGGASTPAGASASAPAAQVETNNAMGDAVKRASGNALALAGATKDLEERDSRISLNNAAEAAKEQEKFLYHNNARKAEADTINAQLNAEALRKKMPAIKAGSEYDAAKASYDKEWIKYDSNSRRALEATGVVRNATSAAEAFRGPKQKIPRNPKKFVNKYGETVDISTGEMQ